MRILVAGWIGSTNLGDELLFSCAKRELESRGAEVTALSVRPAATARAHGCDAVSALRPDAIWRAVGAADAVVAVGGTMQDVSSPFNLPFHTLPLRIAAARNTPAVGLGLGVERISTPLGVRLARRALGSLSDLTVRDEASAQVVLGLGLPRPTVTADLVLGAVKPSVTSADVVGICLRNWNGGSALPVAARWSRGLRNEWFVEGMASALDAIGAPVRFIALQAGRDDVLHQRIGERMRSPFTHADASMQNVLDEIGACRSVVSMRYHGAVAGAAAGRPVVVFDAFAKLRAFAEEASLPILTWDQHGIDELPSRLETASYDDEAVESLRRRERGNAELLDRLVG